MLCGWKGVGWKNGRKMEWQGGMVTSCFSFKMEKIFDYSLIKVNIFFPHFFFKMEKIFDYY